MRIVQWMQKMILAAALALGLALVMWPSPVHADACTWLGGAGNWSDPTKWSCSHAPGAGDTAIINGGTVTVDSQTSVHGLTHTGGTVTGLYDVTVMDQFDWTGGTQSGAGTTVVAPGATLYMYDVSRTLYGRTLDVQGTAIWTAGNINLQNAATINNSGTFQVQTDADLNFSSLDTSTFNNSGSFVKSAGSGDTDVEMHLYNAGSVQVLIGRVDVGRSGSVGSSSGSFSVSSGATLQFNSGSHTLESTSSVNGGGRVLFSGATVTIHGTYNLTGPTSTTEVSGGTVDVEAGATVVSIGQELLISGGTLNLNSGEPIDVTAMMQSGGTLGGADTVTVADTFSWTGGTQGGTGAIVVPSGATLDLSGSNRTLNGRTLDMQGSATWIAGNINLQNAAIINNSGTFDAKGDVDLIDSTGDTCTFNNSGSFVKSGGSGTTDVQMHLYNAGSVQVLIGTMNLGRSDSLGSSSGSFSVSAGAVLRFGDGSHTLASGSSVSGGGTVEFSGATMTVLGSYSLTGTTQVSADTVDFEYDASIGSIGQELLISGGTLNLNSSEPITPTVMTQSGGVLDGADTVTVAGTFQWTGGTQRGIGTTVVAPGATLDLSGSNRWLRGRTLAVQGTAAWTTGTLYLRDAATIENSGTFDLQGDVDLDHDGGDISTFTNTGWFRKTAGSGTSYEQMHFYNSGSIEVQIGTLQIGCGSCVDTSSGSFSVSAGAVLRFSDGSHTLASGSSVNGGGTVEFSGATMTVLGSYNLTGTTQVSADTVDFEYAATVDSIGQELLISGGTLNLDSGEPITPTTMTQSGGVLDGADTVTVAGTFQWTGGTQRGIGTTVVAPGATLILSGSNRWLRGRTLAVQGTAAWTAGTLYLSYAATIENSGTFDLQGDVDLDHYGGDLSTFYNYNMGWFGKTAGSGTSLVEMHFHNAGSIEVQIGTLRVGCVSCVDTSSGSFSMASGATLQFNNGTHTLASTSSVTGGGTLWFSSGTMTILGAYNLSGTTQVSGGTVDLEAGATVISIGSALVVSGGTLNLDSGEPITPAMLEQSSGTLGGGDTVTAASGFSWTGGTQAGEGTTRVPVGAALNLSGSSRTLDRRTLSVEGTTAWTAGTLNLKNAATIENDGTFYMHGDLDLNHYGGDVSTFYNSGLFGKTAGSGTADVEMHLYNDGVVAVESGTLRIGYSNCTDTSHGAFGAASGARLQFSNGTHTLASGSSVSGDGTILFSGGTVTIAGTYNLNGTTQVTGSTVYFSSGATSVTVTLTQSGGTLAGTGHLVAGLWTWTGGTQSGSGLTTLATFGTLDLSGGEKTLDSRTLELQGATTWTAGTINLKNAATINNSGTFDVQSDVHLNHYSGDLSTFNNAGTFQKSGSSGTSDVKVHFHNAGSLQVLQGTLRLGTIDSSDSSSGAFTVASGATLQFSNGTHTLASGSWVSGAGSVQFSGGTVTVFGEYDLNGTTRVTGGTVNFSSETPSLTLGLTQSSGTLAGTGQLVAGLWTWTGGSQGGFGVTTLAVNGTLTLSGGAKTLNGRTLDLQGATTWTAGNIELKNAATLFNSGTFDVQSDVHLNHYDGGLSTFNNNGTLQKSGSSGTTEMEVHLNNAGNLHVFQGTLCLAHSDSNGSSSGTFAVASGANLRFQSGIQTLTPDSSVTGAGTVQFSGATVTVSGDYDLGGTTQISGGTADFSSAASVAFADLFQSDGTLNLDNHITISGDWTRDGGTFNAGSGSVTFVGTSEQAIGGYAITPFYHLVVNSGAIVAISATEPPIVTGALANHGTLKQTRNVNNSGSGDPATFSFLHILDWAGHAKHSGVDIRIEAGANMGSTTVYVHGNQTCGLSNGVLRCYEIDPSDISVPSTIWFYYRAAEANGNIAPYAWHWDGVVWRVVDPFPTRGQPHPEGYWVRATGVNEYSPFALADDPSMVWHRVWVPMVRR